MASLAKRLRAYAGPVLLVYTVLVTWVLISTAWSEHDQEEDSLGRGKQQQIVADRTGRSGRSFLDVIVQEERRHMKSFKNAVRSYRDAFVEDGRAGKREERDATGSETNKRDRQTKRRNGSNKDISSKVWSGKRNIKSNKEDQAGQADISSNSQKQAENSDVKKPGSVVEVEGWDQNRGKNSVKNQKVGLNEKKSKLDTNSKQKAAANSLVDIEVDSNLKPVKTHLTQNQTLKLQDFDQFVKFCDQVFTDPNIVPSICDRPPIESTNTNHIPIPNSSLGFRRVGEIKLFSAFLDVRGSEPFIRTMVLAPSEQRNGPSIYWCVFHNLDKTLSSSNDDKFSNVESLNSLQSGMFPKEQNMVHSDSGSNDFQTKTVLGSTVVSFYAASDGHWKAKRFYIASCPVLQKAYTLFSHSNKSISIQIIVGSLETAFLGAVQENTVIDVIINRPIDGASQLATSQPVHKFGKTLLVDVKAPGLEDRDRSLENGAMKYQSSINSSLGTHSQNRKVISVFELDDDDEDKEISREKKHHLKPGNTKSRSDGSITIPLPQVKQVGETIVSCVAPLHGKTNSMQVIEFVELSLLLGVQHIVFYLPSSIDLTDARRAVRMYETRGLVTSLVWDLPGDDQGNQTNAADDVWARGRDVALNDCLYRTVHKFDWAIFLDLDEFFVPRVTPDLPSFLRYLTAQHHFNASRTTDLVFPSAYFPPPTRPQYKNLTSLLGFHRDVNKFSSLKSVHRTYFDQKQTLRMLRPDTVARVGAGERKKTSFSLSHRYASVHHYSFCPRSSPAAKDTGQKSQGGLSCNHLKVDWTMWRFKSLLLDRGRSAVRLLDKG